MIKQYNSITRLLKASASIVVVEEMPEISEKLLNEQDTGKALGYPQCCIDWFCQDVINKLDVNQKKIANKGFGFIPCADHARLIVEKGVSIESIIVGRSDEHKPYPNAFEGIPRNKYNSLRRTLSIHAAIKYR